MKIIKLEGHIHEPSEDVDDKELRFHPEIRSVIKGKDGRFKLVKYLDVPIFQWLEYNHGYWKVIEPMFYIESYKSE